MSFFDDLMGRTAADTSNRAAQDTYGKQTRAVGDITNYGDQYASQFRDLAKGYDPWVNAGQGALTRLMGGLGLGGAKEGQAFADAYHALPGYQSGLDTGTNAALRGINASGMSNSGAALKALQRFGSNYEDQRVGDYMSRLMGLEGQGLGATGAQIGTVGQGLQGQLGTRQSAFQGSMNAADTIGQGMVAGEQAKQKALGNLMGMAGQLGGSFLGGFGKPVGNAFGNWAFGGGGQSSYGKPQVPNGGWGYGE